MLNCNEATRLMSEDQDRQLSIKERIDLRIHNFMCSGCTNFKQQMQAIRKAMRGYASGNYESKPVK